MVQLLLALVACDSTVTLGEGDQRARIAEARPEVDADTGSDDTGDDTDKPDTDVPVLDTDDEATGGDTALDTGDTDQDTGSDDTAETGDTSSPAACKVPEFTDWPSDLWIGVDEPQSFSQYGCGTVISASCMLDAIEVAVNVTELSYTSAATITFVGTAVGWSPCEIVLRGDTGLTTTWTVNVAAR